MSPSRAGGRLGGIGGKGLGSRKMVSGISLANKCQLLFGFAVAVILTAALSVPWARASSLVRAAQVDVSRELARAWLEDQRSIDRGAVVPVIPGVQSPRPRGPVALDRPGPLERLVAEDASGDARQIAWVPIERAGAEAPGLDPFVVVAARVLRDDPDADEHDALVSVEGRIVHRYARTVRASEWTSGAAPMDEGSAGEGAVDDPVVGLLVIDRVSPFAEQQLLISRVYIAAAGLAGMLLAVLVFYFVLTKLILSPVRRLRRTTDSVQAGALAIRSDIRTGDEFEELSEAFNAMLDRLQTSQEQLRSMNEALDLKMSELAEANVGLYESNRLKSEFLANVSHELRTPLNSIIGFAELLEQLARSDAASDPKRLRYLGNILTSGRHLLEMINDLLDMAKIEAGRMEVVIEPVSMADLIEGLAGIMRPQAESKDIDFRTRVAGNLPIIETDAGKVQQILFNFVSNAMKFTPAGGRVSVVAERVRRQDGSTGVRVGVTDTGPGVPEDMQDLIFEKFRQVDPGHTREHQGTGLGLAICRELAEMLGATVSFTSEPGRGATFFIELPLVHQPDEPKPLLGSV